jgi:argininosuccinate lyase
MHLWDKGGRTRASLISFTCSDDRAYDARMAPYDIVGSMAHATMLMKCGLISAGEREQLLTGLSALFAEAGKADFEVGPDYEDIHSFVELRLRDLAGAAAGKLHTGRSRNDQVLTDIHLYVRDKSFMLAEELNKLAAIMLDLSQKHETALMPGFTHMQAAMVSSFGLWFASYAESICDDLQALSVAASFADASPLGTAAGYGTSLPIDREMTASLLNFGRLVVTSPYAQMSRGRMERQITSAIASAANTLATFASDVILFMSPGYGFVTLSDDLTTGSSIMPQKRNPDLFELLRARSNRLQAIPGEVAMMTAGLPPGYNRDYQELKAILFDAFEGIMELVQVMQDAVAGLKVNMDILNDPKYNDIFSAEEANDLVRRGVPFREAYRTVAEKAGSGLYRVSAPGDYSHTGSIGNIGRDIIRERLQAVMEGFKSGCSAQDLFDKIVSIRF